MESFLGIRLDSEREETAAITPSLRETFNKHKSRMLQFISTFLKGLLFRDPKWKIIASYV
jgi:hypothetical protein